MLGPTITVPSTPALLEFVVHKFTLQSMRDHNDCPWALCCLTSSILEQLSLFWFVHQTWCRSKYLPFCRFRNAILILWSKHRKDIIINYHRQQFMEIDSIFRQVLKFLFCFCSCNEMYWLGPSLKKIEGTFCISCLKWSKRYKRKEAWCIGIF